MHPNPVLPRHPPRIQVTQQQRRLEEHQARHPDRRRSPSTGSNCFAAIGSTRNSRNAERNTATPYITRNRAITSPTSIAAHRSHLIARQLVADSRKLTADIEPTPHQSPLHHHPNLLRSDMVLNDQNGELIATVVQNGRGEMPKIDLTAAQLVNIAAYLHSFHVGGYDISRNVPPSILVGDAAAGQAYFKATCASCHSVEKDMKGIGARFTDAKQLQNYFLMPGGRGGRGGGAATPTTVTVTLTSGKKVEGRLVRIDDFIVTLADTDGLQHTFRRDGDRPKVEIHDPLEPHKKLLTKYTDADIHNLTSYLVTLK